MTQNEPAALENAEAIIEKFGGIRPMATKINVPVTTVQGWKKRNVIPGTRRAQIISAAQEHGVDLAELLEPKRALQGSGANMPSSIANENDRSSSFAHMVEEEASRTGVKARLASRSEFESELLRSERRAVTKSTAINLFLVIVSIICVIVLLVPQSDRRFDALESDVNSLKRRQSFLSSLVPTDIQAKLSSIQNQLTRYQTGFGSALGKAKTVSDDVLGPNAGNLQQRATKLETHMNDMGMQPANLTALATRLQNLAQSAGGQAQLNASTQQLMALLAGVPSEDPAQIDQALQGAQQNPELAQTFEGVPPQDLKAAALLLGMMQFRSTLNRDNQPFEQDLALMKKLAGNNDPELLAAIDRLAPYAQQGVLTPTGLSQEFRGLAGDVVVASLQGEDVSVKERAQARLGDMFKVEKNGEPVTGTETQKTLVRTDKMLQEGNLEGAIAQMQTLDGPALAAAQPWLTKAQATLMAQKFKHMLSGAINKGGIVGSGGPVYNAGSPMPSARGLNIPGSTKLIQDEETGINILRPNTGKAPSGQ